MKKTKIALTLVCAILLVAASVMGTLAYLTATTGTVTNTFTVGKVSFDVGGGLDEAKVDQYGNKEYKEDGTTLKDRVTANTYKLVPGHTYTKDPTVHIGANSENAWLFVKVTNGISAIEATGTTTIASQMTNHGWTPVATGSNVYYYKEQVKANDDIVVFNSFKLDDNAGVSTYGSANITIQAGIVQADGFATATEAWTANSTLFDSAS